MSKLLSLFFPDRCPYCRKVITPREYACADCLGKFPEFSFTNYAIGGFPCYSPFFYMDSYAEAVKRFKFKNKSGYSPKLAVPLAKSIEQQGGGAVYDAVTCVPMHPKKQKRRGYNQSELLARDAARLLGLRYESLLVKTKQNLEQHKCASRSQRRENVRGVYEAADKELIRGKNILIIDDILTTGYTLGECCRVLKKSGARMIACATLCARNNLPVR